MWTVAVFGEKSLHFRTYPATYRRGSHFEKTIGLITTGFFTTDMISVPAGDWTRFKCLQVENSIDILDLKFSNFKFFVAMYNKNSQFLAPSRK